MDIPPGAPGVLSQQQMTRENNFDLIRLIAAIQVMAFHGMEHLLDDSPHKALIAWFPGLPVFFFVSGFLISASFERSASIAAYARNRVLRIFPALWVCLVVSVLLVVLIGFPLITDPLRSGVLGWWFAQMTIFQFFNPEWLRGFGVGVLNGSLWSIPVELQFYVALPVIYWIGRAIRRLDAFILASAALALLASLAASGWIGGREGSLAGKLVTVSIVPYLYMFLVGTLLHRACGRGMLPWLENKGHWWLALYLLACWVGGQMGWRVGTNLPHPVLAVLLGVTTISLAYSWRGLSRRLLGGHDLSYGIYIYHMPVFNGLLVIGAGASASWMLLGMIISIALAALSWRLIESRFLSKRTHAPAGIAQARQEPSMAVV